MRNVTLKRSNNNLVLFFSTAAVQTSHENKDKKIQECLKYLEENNFIQKQKYENGKTGMVPKQLGSACLASSLSPEEGIIVYKELTKARNCFVLSNDLHVVYQVIILNFGYLNWLVIY